MTDGDSMTINNLRDSANVTFVTLDDYLSLTGYEPNAMEFTNATELNDAVSSDFIDFQDSLVHIAPSSDHDVDDETLGKLLAEVHRGYADYRRPEGVSVSPSSVSVMVNRTGKPVDKSDIDQFGFSVRNVLTIPWNSAKLVKISPGIIARLHHTDRRQMVLRKEQCAE